MPRTSCDLVLLVFGVALQVVECTRVKTTLQRLKASDEMTAGSASSLDSESTLEIEDIINLAGESAARQAIVHASMAKGPEEFNERGNVNYNEEWFTNHCVPDEVAPETLDDQMSNTADGQKQMKQLVEQVNAMSIDGILRHLLSFYICMRWVPDERFVSALQFEMEHVSVDSRTKAKGEPISEDEIFKMYADFDLVPLKCGKAMHVQATHEIDTFLKAANDKSSGLAKSYEYSKGVAKTSLGFLNIKWGSGGNPAKVKKALQDGSRQAAETALGSLPFDGFIRPSQQFEWALGKHKTHESAADNLFFICFGPRVTSFPHKRADAPHVLADMNMAGCNGLWDLPDMVEHVERVKRLFAPELCLTDDLRMKLKEVFLSTFMEMNSDFFEFMTGNFVQETGLIEAIPKVLRQSGTINKPVPLLAQPDGDAEVVRTLEPGLRVAMAGVDASTGYAKVAYPFEGWIPDPTSNVDNTAQDLLDKESKGRVEKKYKRSARILAGAHTKWIVCDAKPNVTHELGYEDNFFRNPKAYAKWLDIKVEKKAPECKLMDPTTGCIKCAVSVKSDPYRCTVRLGLEPKHVLDALDRGQYPMQSKYYVRDLTHPEENKVKTMRGACLVGRSAKLNISRNALQDNFAAYDKAHDEVYVVTSDGPQHFTTSARYRLEERIENHEKVLEAKEKGDPIPQQSEKEAVAKAIALSVYQEQHENSATKHVNSQFGPLLTFEEHVPQQNNRPSHFVQYVVSCPCDAADFSSLDKHSSFASAELTDFYNAGGAP